MDTHHPSFATRAKRMRDMAMELKTIAEEVLAEAQRMAAAESRFAERKVSRQSARASR